MFLLSIVKYYIVYVMYVLLNVYQILTIEYSSIRKLKTIK